MQPSVERRAALIAIGLLAVSIQPLRAQTPVAPPPLPDSLTLADALRIGHEQNPVYRVQEAQLDANEAAERANASWLNYLPTIWLGFSATALQSRQLAGRDDFGRPIPLDEPITFRQTDFEIGPQFGTITLFDGGNRIRNSRSTRAGLRGERARIDGEALTAESELIIAYYAAVVAAHQVDAAARQVEFTKVNLEAANRLLRVGAQDPLDVLSAELEALEAENSLEQALGEVRKAKLVLLNEMGIGAEIDFGLADELPQPFDPATINAATLVSLALENSPQIASATASSEQSRYSLLNAQAGRWPTLTANLGISPGNPVGSGADPLFYLNPMNQTYRASVTVSLNIFDRLRTSTEIASARAGFVAASENQRALRLQVENRVRELLIDLDNIHRRIDLQERTAALSIEQAELSQEKYRLGALSFRDLQIAIDAAFTAEQDALNARLDFARTRVEIEGLVGRRLEGL